MGTSALTVVPDLVGLGFALGVSPVTVPTPELEFRLELAEEGEELLTFVGVRVATFASDVFTGPFGVAAPLLVVEGVTVLFTGFDTGVTVDFTGASTGVLVALTGVSAGVLVAFTLASTGVFAGLGLALAVELVLLLLLRGAVALLEDDDAVSSEILCTCFSVRFSVC